MLKKTAVYEDFEGNAVAETLHFFISKAELIELEKTTPGGFVRRLQSIMGSESTTGLDIANLIKDFILISYGEKDVSPNGRILFVKKRNGVPVRDEFEQSLAFEAIFSELVMDPDKAAAFINGVMPQDLIEEAKKEQAKEKQVAQSSENI